MITQQDTETTFFGASADVYSWWRNPKGGPAFKRRFRYNSDYEAPDGWSYIVHGADPDDPGSRAVMVTHSVVMGAVRRIAEGRLGLLRPGRTAPSEECVNECKAFLEDPESADFDAGTADEVLQVIVFSGVVYG